jgi:hypothetical protein
MLKCSWLLIGAGIALGLQSMALAQEKAVRTADVTKTVRIEKPTSTILAHNTAGVPESGKRFVNPNVQPGGVHWHPSWAAACDAARKSKKPVLLFQMMGKLDDQFC